MVLSPNLQADEVKNNDSINSIKENNSSSLSLISFNQYIELEFDKSELNKPLPIDQAVVVPVNVTYTHDVPDSFLSFLKNFAPLIYNKFLFGNMMPPQQQIQLTISDQPEWADIYFDDPILDIPIPDPGKTTTRKVNLVITVNRKAPAQSTSINVHAECNDVGRLKANSKNHMLSFTPAFIPCIEVETISDIYTTPGEVTDVIINITNCGNDNVIIKTSIDAPMSWQTLISAQEIYLSINASEEIILSMVQPPEEHNGILTITVTLDIYRDPIHTYDPEYPPVMVYYTIHY